MAVRRRSRNPYSLPLCRLACTSRAASSVPGPGEVLVVGKPFFRSTGRAIPAGVLIGPSMLAGGTERTVFACFVGLAMCVSAIPVHRQDPAGDAPSWPCSPRSSSPRPACGTRGASTNHGRQTDEVLLAAQQSVSTLLRKTPRYAESIHLLQERDDQYVAL
jgi:hypothetical protein